MKSLQTLHFFSVGNSPNNIKGLKELTNLTDLKITGFGDRGSSDEAVEKHREILLTFLEKLCNLKYPEIRYLEHGTYWDVSCSTPASFCDLQRFHGFLLLRVPSWIGQLHNLYDLYMTIKLVFEEDVGILALLPSLISLQLHIRGATEEILIPESGFPVLKRFTLGYSRMSCLAFEAGAMSKLAMLELRFNAHRWHRYHAAPSGIEYLSGLKKISATRETNIKAAESALRNAVDMHPGRPSTNIDFLFWWPFEDTRHAFEDIEEDEHEEQKDAVSIGST